MPVSATLLISDAGNIVIIVDGEEFSLLEAEEKGWVEPQWGDQDQYAELVEARAELARHHRDFERIRVLVHEALEATPADNNEALINALGQIRHIIG